MRHLPNGRNTVDKIRRNMCCPFTSHSLINLSVGLRMRETAEGFASELCRECNVSLHVGRCRLILSALSRAIWRGSKQVRGSSSDDSGDLGYQAEPQLRSRGLGCLDNGTVVMNHQ